MYLKNFLTKVSIVLAFITFFVLGQNAWAATWYSQGAVTLNVVTNWNSQPNGSGTNLVAWVNTDDYVVQNTHVLTFAASTFNTLRISSTGAHVTAAVTVNGNVIVDASCSPTAGGAVTVNGGLTIENGANLTLAANMTANSLTVTDANLTLTANTFTSNGNVTLTGNSSVTSTATGGFTFATATTKTLSVGSNAYFAVGTLSVPAGTVNTTSDFTVLNALVVAGTFNATGGVATFNTTAGASNLWNNTGTLTLFDVLLNLPNNGTPSTNLSVSGDFTKIGAGNFAPTGGTITFNNTNPGGKNLQLVGGTNSFVNFVVASGATITTSSDFRIGDPGTPATAATFVVNGTGTFLAQAGTITVVSNTTTITNSATGNMTFNNFVNDATGTATTTSSSFKITGNFTTAAASAFTASNGTITFENNIQKTLTLNTAPTFFNVLVATGSDITTGNNATINGNLTLEANSEFTATANAITFGGGTTKTITVASTANLEFFNLSIADVASNVVQTASNFTVASNMVYAAVTNNPSFNATAGTVNFTHATPTITSSGTNPMSFYNLQIQGGTVTLAASQLISIKKDLLLNQITGPINGTLAAADATPTVTFLGTENSKITGTTAVAIPATFGVLVINKTDATDEVLLELDAAVFNAGALTLTNGILNLGSKTLTSGALPTSAAGKINGATGTYVISTGHAATGLIDNLFTVNGVPTLYNLDVLVAHTLGAGNLTVNGNLDITGAVAFTIPAAQTLTLHGNFDNSGSGTIVGANAATSVWVLTGSGTANELENATFGALMPSLTFLRGETLSGNLTLDAANILTINTSVSNVDIGANTLTFNNTSVLNLVSGSIKADAGSVVFGTHASQTTIPANIFINNTVNDLTIAAATTLGGDLIINGTLTGLFSITTNTNTLTFGPNATLPAYVAATHIIGNLKRTVTNTATVFPIGGGTAASFRPIALQFQTAGSSQLVKVSSQLVNPTLGRGGDPTRAVNALWTITPEGTTPSDNLAIDFGWGTSHDNGLVVGATTSFPARWNSTAWVDYRSGYGTIASANFIANSELTPSTSTYPVASSALNGNWAVFIATAATDAAKDAAISTSDYKLAITNISANPVEEGFPFSMTVQLQDQYGNPVIVPTDGPYTVTFTDLIGTATILPPGVIAVGQSSVQVNGFSYASTGTGNQILANITAPAAPPRTIAPILPTASPVINVLGPLPGEQVSGIIPGGGTLSSTLTFTLTTGNAVIIMKAGSPITEQDFPVDGTTYYASNNYGQGSSIGDAVVVYKGAASGTPITVNGLSPNTTYYIRGFAFTGTPGAEKYIKFSAAQNPRTFTTGGGIDDDVVFGANNTRATAKPIGTNTPVLGTIKSATDEDWFSFAITNSSPNLRSLLTLSGALGNYNIEVYNSEGRRIRRGTRVGNFNEAQVINDLPSGTYTVRIFGVNGAFDANITYTLKLTTKGNEIFSVTP